jgi:hypothetical protein
MNNSEYFQAIGKKVHEKRTKGEYSREEMRIFREGKKQAYKDVIAMFIAAHTSAKKKKEFVGIFEKGSFTPEELCHFCELEVKYFSDALSKALKRCLQQEKTLALFSQLQI